MLLYQKKKLVMLYLDDQILQLEATKFFLERHPDIERVYTAQRVQEMCDIISKNKDINCLVLDVNLGIGQMTGPQAYSMLKGYGIHMPAIMITGETVIPPTSLQPGIVDVVEKSSIFNDFDRLATAVNHLQDHFKYLAMEEHEFHVISVKQGREHIELIPRDVISIIMEQSGTCPNIYTTFNDGPFTSTLNLSFYENYCEMLPQVFFRVSRFAIVNVNHIVDIKKDRVTMLNGMVIPIGETYFKTMKKIFEIDEGTIRLNSTDKIGV